MKLYGIAGKGSGRLGSHVYAINGGEQIVRAYNPIVTNPSTDAQVKQRSKFKLLTQLAAAMASVIVIPKKGTTSARNLFVSKNIGFANNDELNAKVEYEKLQLTNGIASIAAVNALRGDTPDFQLGMATSMAGLVDRVVYIMFKKTTDGKLQYVASKVATTAGLDGTFSATIPAVDDEVVIYAYGMSDNTSGAKTRYENYEVENGEDIATLIATRNLKASDYTFTATSGTTIAAA